MSAPAIYVAGTRTFAGEAADFAADAGFHVVGLLEPYERARAGTVIHGLPVVWLEDAPPPVRTALVGTGERDRRAIAERLRQAGFALATLVHPRAHVSRTSALGAGTIVGPGAVVGAYATLEECVVLGRGALVGHHTAIGAFATLGPGANVAGNVRIGEDVFVGMAAAVRDHVTVGARAVVAMGAVVVADVPAGVEVRGVPAAARSGSAPGRARRRR